jgi:hypothetical protein
MSMHRFLAAQLDPTLASTVRVRPQSPTCGAYVPSSSPVVPELHSGVPIVHARAAS